MSVVTNLNDSGTGSLRAAIATGGTITFQSGLTGTINLLSVLTVTVNTDIIGPGSGIITVANNTSPVVNFRIFLISADLTVSISGLTLSGGIVPGEGGAILIDTGATCNLNGMVITNNSGTNGGGMFVTSGATCNISTSTIMDNSTTGATGVGGGIDNAGTTTITYSTITGNDALTNGGGINNSGTLTIEYCTINGNSLSTAGAGAGLNNASGRTTISNSTFNENIDVASVTLSINITAGTVTIENGTIHNLNETETITNNSNLTLTNSVVDITAGTGPVTVQGNNWFSSVQGDPGLGALQNNGGPTLTMAPTSASSGVVNAGDVDFVTSPTDQRGFARTINGMVDLGSVEYGSGPIVCYSAESKILTKNIITGVIAEVRAADIVSNVHRVFDTQKKIFVPVKYNIVTGPINRFTKLGKNIMGINKPSEDLHITSGHRVMIKGKPIKASKIPGAVRIKVNPQYVYSICTNKKTAILVNGLAVVTWGKQEWHEYNKLHSIHWLNNTVQNSIARIC